MPSEQSTTGGVRVKLLWLKDRYVEESRTKAVKDGDAIYVDDVMAELRRAAAQPIGVFGVGYHLPDKPDADLFAIAEAIRVALGFERTDSDLQHGGVQFMHDNFFDRFVRDVPGANWRLRITVVTRDPRPDTENLLFYVGSGTVTNRLLQPDDVLNVLLPFVQNELEPQLRLHTII